MRRTRAPPRPARRLRGRPAGAGGRMAPAGAPGGRRRRAVARAALLSALGDAAAPASASVGLAVAYAVHRKGRPISIR